MAAEAAVETKAIAEQAMSNDRNFTESPKSSKRSHLLQLSKRPSQCKGIIQLPSRGIQVPAPFVPRLSFVLATAALGGMRRPFDGRSRRRRNSLLRLRRRKSGPDNPVAPASA